MTRAIEELQKATNALIVVTKEHALLSRKIEEGGRCAILFATVTMIFLPFNFCATVSSKTSFRQPKVLLHKSLTGFSIVLWDEWFLGSKDTYNVLASLYCVGYTYLWNFSLYTWQIIIISSENFVSEKSFDIVTG